MKFIKGFWWWVQLTLMMIREVSEVIWTRDNHMFPNFGWWPASNNIPHSFAAWQKNKVQYLALTQYRPVVQKQKTQLGFKYMSYIHKLVLVVESDWLRRLPEMRIFHQYQHGDCSPFVSLRMSLRVLHRQHFSQRASMVEDKNPL